MNWFYARRGVAPVLKATVGSVFTDRYQRVCKRNGRASGLGWVAAVVATGACAIAASPLRADYDFNVLANFHNIGGFALENSTPIADSSGNLYGTNFQSGSVYQYSPTTGILTPQFGTGYASFRNSPGHSEGQPTIDSFGNIYATTYFGSDVLTSIPDTTSVGTLYMIDGATHAVTNLSTFSGTSSGHPRGALVVDSTGSVFGTTEQGGASFDGTIYKYDATSKTTTTILQFNGANGATPFGGLTVGPDGNYYGTTVAGGTNNLGTVFKFNPTTQTLTTLVSFADGYGAHPTGAVTFDAHGNLYGTTSEAGGITGDGTVFVIPAATGQLQSLWTFEGNDGANPLSEILIDKAGNVFGTTSEGGPNGFGTVFQLVTDPNNPLHVDSLVTLHAFGADPTEGLEPNSGLYEDADGNLFGTTFEGSGGGLYELSVVPEPACVGAIFSTGLLIFARRRRCS